MSPVLSISVRWTRKIGRNISVMEGLLSCQNLSPSLTADHTWDRHRRQVSVDAMHEVCEVCGQTSILVSGLVWSHIDCMTFLAKHLLLQSMKHYEALLIFNLLFLCCFGAWYQALSRGEHYCHFVQNCSPSAWLMTMTSYNIYTFFIL